MINGSNQAQTRHGVLPTATFEEEARQDFVASLKFHIATELSAGLKSVYDGAVEPAFSRQQARPPKNLKEVKGIMQDEPAYKYWSVMQRASQEMMWQSCQISIERQTADLFSRGLPKGASLGSLKLDPNLEMPKYISAVDIHCMPGGYSHQAMAGDMSQGALYDRGVFVYTLGRLGRLNDDLGHSLAKAIQRNYPDLKPRRILDMGCTVGNSTLPYADYFPDAEIYAIDVAGPVLEYAHARAESLGVPVHFSQQNAEKTNFPDGYFDLIVSHILVHETANGAIRRIMKEAYRLLSPGGVLAHAEAAPYLDLDPYTAFVFDWDATNNNEPFWTASHMLDPVEMAEVGGFGKDAAFTWSIPSHTEEAKVKQTNTFQAGDFGGSGLWYVFGARKAAS